jgi:hypothetical protein
MDGMYLPDFLNVFKRLLKKIKRGRDYSLPPYRIGNRKQETLKGVCNMELIKGGAEHQKAKPDLSSIYLRNLQQKITQYLEQPENRDILKQMIFYGIKFCNTYKTYEPYKYLQSELALFQMLTNAIGLLTPAELLTIFPLDKDYDGHKYGIKDYFYSMKTIREIGLNNVIGDMNRKLLWDYWNMEINDFEVNMMEVISSIRQLEGHRSLAEDFLEMLVNLIHPIPYLKRQTGANMPGMNQPEKSNELQEKNRDI